ncbi:unnamed protein product [Linum trigynum]|uniref:Uncharacterized protein n=1 Tax=Linum trigynum TaxID=586398 RepID=A0AAV2E6V8_9ROSI
MKEEDHRLSHLHGRAPQRGWTQLRRACLPAVIQLGTKAAEPPRQQVWEQREIVQQSRVELHKETALRQRRHHER